MDNQLFVDLLRCNFLRQAAITDGILSKLSSTVERKKLVKN